MGRVTFKPGNMLYPLPAVMVSCKLGEERPNIITLAWAGTICSDPAMVSISVRKERFSHHIIKESGEFVINLTTRDLAKATDLCGVKSGRDIDKFKEARLTPLESQVVSCPSIEESPVSIECKVEKVLELGSHDMFIGKVVNVTVKEELLNDKGTLNLKKANLMTYSHGRYYELGKELGTFGYSVKKKSKKGKNSKRSKTSGAKKIR